MKGAVISDLHLFSGRNRSLQKLHALIESYPDLQLLVLNGDIFDFHWHPYQSAIQSHSKACEILANICSRYSAIEFIYISGNHDQEKDFLPYLDKLKASTENFTYRKSFYLTNDGKLFHHGDLFFAKSMQRHYKLNEKMPNSFLYKAYQWITKCGINRIVELPFKAKIICPLIEKRWADFFNQYQVQQVFFGHTHVPFENFSCGKRLYHNTGTFIYNQKFRFITFNTRNNND